MVLMVVRPRFEGGTASRSSGPSRACGSWETRERKETWGLARESVLTVMTVTSKQEFDGMYEHSRIRVGRKLSLV